MAKLKKKKQKPKIIVPVREKMGINYKNTKSYKGRVTSYGFKL